SDHYLEHIRTNDADRDRILGCIRALEQKLAGAFPDGGWHIDIGCGPGHVLKWTQEWASSRKVKQIGLDVSMQNLRNTRRNTNAFVVLGDATCMPFKDGIAALVSEASVLHHIADWKACVAESCRIAHSDGAIVYDNEPTAASLDWSPLARRIFEGRFYGYHVLSYFMKSKRNFRNIALAKYNYYEAEVHNQPGRGFVPSEVEETFSKRGRDCKIYYRAGPDLQTGSGRNSLQMNFLLFMSTRDWRNPERGIMTLIAS
ncbi:MAG: class I SAM-dependent methyltransferase, partial [Flavobacteriaceae bacterium]